MKLKAHASEGGTHWYTKSGEPAYTVKAKDGSDRATTLWDARKLNLYPSTTTIIKMAAAPGLERWKQQQVLHAALTLPKIDGETEADYLDRIMADSREQGKKAAQRGTDIHAALEGWYGIPRKATIEMLPYCEGVAKVIGLWADAHPTHASWDAELSFAHPLGFGGKCDLSCDGMVADFKSTEKDLATIKTWEEHAMQLAAYREGLGMPEARCAIVYVSVTQPGQAKVIELSEDELMKGWDMFKALLEFHQAKTGYRP